MATIRVRTLSINNKVSPFGGVTGLTSTFTDTFTRANSNNLGYGWIQPFYTTSSAGAACAVQITSNVCSFVPATSNTTSTQILPWATAWLTQVQRNHFSEIVIGTNSVAAFGYGPAVVMSLLNGSASGAPGPVTGFYYCQWNGTNLQIFRFVYNGNSNTGALTLSLITFATTVTTGDVLRLEATISGATWTLTVKKNGTVVGSTTDSTLVQGAPGMYYAGASGVSVSSTTITRFSGGAL